MRYENLKFADLNSESESARDSSTNVPCYANPLYRAPRPQERPQRPAAAGIQVNRSLKPEPRILLGYDRRRTRLDRKPWLLLRLPVTRRLRPHITLSLNRKSALRLEVCLVFKLFLVPRTRRSAM